MVNVNLGPKYIPDLKKRLKAADISMKAVSREMAAITKREAATCMTQLSRWMNGHVAPDVKSIVVIEDAIARIEKRQGRE